jgi:hypothetical protein
MRQYYTKSDAEDKDSRHHLIMTCPCCGKDEENIFLHQPYALQPLALQWSREESEIVVRQEESGIVFLGRYFLQADIPLPLKRKDSPIVPRVWIEVSEEVFYSLKEVYSGAKRRMSAGGVLACDIPGFPGTVGSPLRFRLLSPTSEIEIISLADSRIEAIGDDLSHNEMVSLYRKTWGNTGYVPRVSLQRRSEVSKAWEEYLGTSLFSRETETPPQLAGLPPGEVLLAPPLDTNRKAVFCTVGCSDVRQSNGRRVEIASWIRNPPDDFIRCFGEFAYLSHLNPQIIAPGAVIPEQNPIPGSQGQMFGWILVIPWWVEEDSFFVDDQEVSILAAIPLLASEIRFAAMIGVDNLLSELENTDVDIYSLLRDAAVTVEE